MKILQVILTKLTAYPNFQPSFVSKVVTKLLSILGDLYCVQPALEIIALIFVVPAYERKADIFT